MTNLIKNGVKFTPSGKVSIYIAYDELNELLCVHVVDTGKGVLMEDIPKMFSMFGKLHRTAAQNSEGIGMGLMVCKKLVQ